MKVTVARIYVTEGEHIHAKLFKRLHDEEQVRGVTIFRGITGFGKSGKVHSSILLDMSMDLPVVIEFFDAPDKIDQTLQHLRDMVQPEHVLTFAADLT
jgi:PII-like signaling protein